MPDIPMRVRRHTGNTSEYAEYRQKLLAQIARYRTYLRRENRRDPFNNTDVHNELKMLRMLELTDYEAMRFRLDILRTGIIRNKLMATLEC
jgi:hypothetical protein